MQNHGQQGVITSQPGFAENAHWQTSAMDCCDDCGICLCGFFFPLSLGCMIASDMNECCLCGGSVAMRTLYRTKYGIPGTICNDYLMLTCCAPCSLCQLQRDINKRKKMGIF